MRVAVIAGAVGAVVVEGGVAVAGVRGAVEDIADDAAVVDEGEWAFSDSSWRVSLRGRYREVRRRMIAKSSNSADFGHPILHYLPPLLFLLRYLVLRLLP